MYQEERFHCNGGNLFVFKLPIMHIFFLINSSRLVLYISILYYSNRGILPDVNACLFTVERQNKRLRIQLSVMISWLSALCCEGTLTEGWKMMPYFTLWISGDSRNWYLRGFLLQCSRCDLIMPFSCVTLFCEDVQDCKADLMPTHLFSCVSSDQSLMSPHLFVSAFFFPPLSGVKWDGSLLIYSFVSWPVLWFVLCIIETLR